MAVNEKLTEQLFFTYCDCLLLAFRCSCADSDGLIITLQTRGTGTDDEKSAFGSRVVTLDGQK